jgi:hypothetical protein
MPRILNKKWPLGARNLLAEKAGLHACYISRLTNRHEQCSEEKAAELALHCKEMGIPISKEDWMACKTTNNPYFGTTADKNSEER